MLFRSEGMKAIYTLAYCWRHKLLTFEIDRKKAISQIKYIFPLGFAGVIFYFNKDLGKLLINAQLGPEALAIFVIGCYQIPFVGIVRGAISDTIFPDMATAIRTNPIKGLAIWQKTNVIYCYLTFPMFTICLFFSNEIVGLLFTEKYLAAASIFQISLLFLIRNCFEFASPLRALNYTKPLLYANFLSALINIPLAFILLKLYGLIGPAIAFFFADTLIAIYSCFFVIKKFQITLSTVLYWRKDFSLIMISFLCLPILYISQICTSQLPNIILVVLSIMLYLLSYIFLCQRARIEESQQLNNLITTKLTSNIKISL